jgi:hypothetical protein
MKFVIKKKFNFLNLNCKNSLLFSIILIIILSINSKKNPLFTEKDKDIIKEQESKEKDSLCKLESIHIPLGNSLPVMVYNAQAVASKKKYRITVLEKDDVEQFNVEGNLFYTDKNTKESWFINESMDDNSFDKIKDSINMCKDLNKNKTNFIGKDKMFSGLRKYELPSFISKRINSNRISSENLNDNKDNMENKENKDKKEENMAKSFLQIC